MRSMADASGLTQPHVAEPTLPAVGTRRPKGRTARTRTAVLTATLTELAAHGYERLTLDGVATRAGVHKTTVYRRWGSKEHVVADALRTLAATRIEVPDTGDLDRDLQLLARSVVTALSSPDGAGTVRAMVSGAHDSEVVRGIVATFWAQRTDDAGEIVRRAVERGQLPPGSSPAQVIRHLGAPLYHQLLVTLDPLTIADADLAAGAVAAAARAGAFVAAADPRP